MINNNKARKNEVLSDNDYNQLIKRLSDINSINLEDNLNSPIHKDINKIKLYLSSIKDIKRTYKDNINSMSYDKTNSKYRINTEVENIRKKLYDKSYINNTDTIITDNPKYYLNVLNKKFINNLKSSLTNKNYSPTKINNKKIIKLNKNIKNIYDDLNIKELQKLYYDIEHKNFLRAESNFPSKNTIKDINNKYSYENYASNNSLFNHPKLYILDLKERKINKLPKIKNKLNEMTIRLDYEKKQKYNIQFKKSYFI